MQSNEFDDYCVADLLDLIKTKYYLSEFGKVPMMDYLSEKDMKLIKKHSFNEFLDELKDRLENTAI